MRCPLLFVAVAFANPGYGDNPVLRDPLPTAAGSQDQQESQAPTDAIDPRAARTAFPQESEKQLPANVDPAMLLDRIQQLEKRLASIEGHLATAPGAQNERVMVSPPTSQFGPVYRFHRRDPIEQPPANMAPQSADPPARPPLSTRGTIGDLQRFNINGQWFYIVPVDDLRASDNKHSRH